ncbi:META domain-containing protein [Rufibacter aurantiacus]|uniref:META domain-containing protein n=1 Tax=Rufibacter aurantiacus TaxID=2817374 RepID=UPI001B311309|nr:META domain-containing protein [Rufibacter aurantiacus]
MQTPLKKLFPLLTVSLLLVLLTGCWKKDDPVPEDKDLFGSYVLQYIELPQEGGGVTRVEGQNIRLHLTNVSTYQQANEPFAYDLNGDMLVNQYFGRYNITGAPIVPSDDPLDQVLEVRQVGTTKVGGTPEQMALEELYLSALEEVNLSRLSNNGNQLVLHSRYQNARLFFVSPEYCSLPQ